MKTLLITALAITMLTAAYAQTPGGFTPDRARTGVLRKLTAEERKKIDSAGVFLWDKANGFTQTSYNFSDIDMNSYELLTASVSFTDKDQAQKVIFSPFKLSRNRSYADNLKINIALKSGVTTLGLGFGGDNSLINSARSKRLLQELMTDAKTPPAPEAGMSATAYIEHVLVPYKTQRLDEQLIRFDEARAKHVWKWSLGYNLQLFSVLASKGNVAGFDTLNAHALKSHNVSGNISYSYNNGMITTGAGMVYSHSQKSANASQKKVAYYSPSFSVSARLINFLSYEELIKTESYKKTLFRPSISAGVLCEFLSTEDGKAAYYVDNVKSSRTTTPFVDLLFTPALQFRIGMPIVRATYADGATQTILGANLQYNFKLSNLAN